MSEQVKSRSRPYSKGISAYSDAVNLGQQISNLILKDRSIYDKILRVSILADRIEKQLKAAVEQMDANNPVITDKEILEEIKRTSLAMTYYISNRLKQKHNGIKTEYVHRRLKKLEKAGLVKKVPSPYATQICWQLTEIRDEQTNLPAN